CRDSADRLDDGGAERATLSGPTARRRSAAPRCLVRPEPRAGAHGDNDTINPPACSAQIYDQARPPKHYLGLPGAEHLPPYLEAGTDQAIVERATIDFLNGYLKRASQSLATLNKDGSLAGVAAITSSTQAPSTPGSCP